MNRFTIGTRFIDSKLTLMLIQMLTFTFVFTFTGCTKLPEVDRATALSLKSGNSHKQAIISECLVKRGEEREIGTYGGYWNGRIAADPMTFNTLTARDTDSRTAIDWTSSSTVQYDPFTRQWSPGLVSFRIENDIQNDIQRIYCTINDSAVWYLPNDDKTVPITSRDIVFWFNEIEGDPAIQHPAYANHFVKMADGSEKSITIEAIDDKNYFYTFPRISSDPILEIAGDFGPYFIFQPAKESAYNDAYSQAIKTSTPDEAKNIASGKAAAAVNNLFAIDTDPKELPTCGPFYIDSYQPGIKLTLKRNPHYFLRDAAGNRLPYLDGLIYHIIRDDESAILEFLNGTTDFTGVPHNKLERLITEQESKDFRIYFGGASLSSSFICLNQNPAVIDPVVQSWFIQKEFRQAISCAINRQELISQIYLGLAEPNNEFFNKANSMYNPEISLEYTYDPERALSLLASIGITPGANGSLTDSKGNLIEFDFSFGGDNDLMAKMASIIAHNLQSLGMKVNLKPTDFQKLVNSILKTYDWEMTSVALGGNYWPTGGSNVWQSSGNFHLWHPNQTSPVTPWEAEVDALYNQGRFAKTPEDAKNSWDRYQHLILEQVPLIYLPYPYSFAAYKNRFGNITFDLLGGHDMGTDIRYVYLK